MASTTRQDARFTDRHRLDRSRWYNGYLVTELATSEETGGAFALIEEVGRKGWSGDPPWHVHAREAESFYVLEGRMTFWIGDEEPFEAGPGALVVLPRGVPHRFEIASEEVRLLLLCTPGGFEGFFRELSEPAEALTLPPEPPGAPDIPRLLAAAQRYEVRILPPG